MLSGLKSASSLLTFHNKRQRDIDLEDKENLNPNKKPCFRNSSSSSTDSKVSEALKVAKPTSEVKLISVKRKAEKSKNVSRDIYFGESKDEKYVFKTPAQDESYPADKLSFECDKEVIGGNIRALLDSYGVHPKVYHAEIDGITSDKKISGVAVEELTDFSLISDKYSDLLGVSFALQAGDLKGFGTTLANTLIVNDNDIGFHNFAVERDTLVNHDSDHCFAKGMPFVIKPSTQFISEHKKTGRDFKSMPVVNDFNTVNWLNQVLRGEKKPSFVRLPWTKVSQAEFYLTIYKFLIMPEKYWETFISYHSRSIHSKKIFYPQLVSSKQELYQAALSDNNFRRFIIDLIPKSGYLELYIHSLRTSTETEKNALWTEEIENEMRHFESAMRTKAESLTADDPSPSHSGSGSSHKSCNHLLMFSPSPSPSSSSESSSSLSGDTSTPGASTSFIYRKPFA